MNALEIVGFVSGLLCVLLHARLYVLGFPVAILSVSVYVIVFFEAKLYADMSLQLIFLINLFYGWSQWAKKGNTSLSVSKSSNYEWLGYISAIVIFGLVIYHLLSNYTNSDMAYSDSITTALSLVAQYMLAKKKIENWILWFIADIIYVGMYINKSLYFTALLYLLYLGLCVYGYLTWHKDLKNQTT